MNLELKVWVEKMCEVAAGANGYTDFLIPGGILWLRTSRGNKYLLGSKVNLENRDLQSGLRIIDEAAEKVKKL